MTELFTGRENFSITPEQRMNWLEVIVNISSSEITLHCQFEEENCFLIGFSEDFFNEISKEIYLYF